MRREHNNVNEKIETEKAPTNFQNRPRQTSPSPEKKNPKNTLGPIKHLHTKLGPIQGLGGLFLGISLE